MTLPIIFPPSSLPKFLAAGHGIELGNNYAPVPRARGHSRLRPKSSGAPRIVSVAWSLSEAEAYDFDFWIEYSLDRAELHFTAEVANQGPGQLFWDAVWVEPPTCVPTATPLGTRWMVTGRILLSGEGEATRPETGALAAEIEVPLLGSASLVLADTPLEAEILVELLPITALRAEITVPLLPLLIPLSCEILVPLDGSGALSSGSSGGGYSLTVEDDATSVVDPAIIIFPAGTVEQDSDGNAVVTIGSTPGGSDTQVQYNDGGSFGGEAAFTYAKTTNTLTVEKVTLTGLLTTVATGTGSAGIVLPHGTAPSAPVNGDLWTTTAGFYGRVNGVTVGPFAAQGGALLYWTESANTSAPNGTINAAIFTPVSSGSSGSAIIAWKGASGFLAVQAPDNTSTGGNLRGIRAVDFQSSRSLAAEVASGTNSGLLATQSSKATGTNSLAVAGSSVTASGAQALGQGTQITADGDNSVVIGAYATARGIQSFVQGSGTSTIGRRQIQRISQFTSSSFSAAVRILATAGGNANEIVLPNNSVYSLTARVLMLGGSDYWDVEIKATVYRGANAASTVINGVTTAITGTTIYTTAGVAGLGWTIDVIADTTAGGPNVRTKADTGQIVQSTCLVELVQLTP